MTVKKRNATLRRQSLNPSAEVGPISGSNKKSRGSAATSTPCETEAAAERDRPQTRLRQRRPRAGTEARGARKKKKNKKRGASGVEALRALREEEKLLGTSRTTVVRSAAFNTGSCNNGASCTLHHACMRCGQFGHNALGTQKRGKPPTTSERRERRLQPSPQRSACQRWRPKAVQTYDTRNTSPQVLQ